MSPPSSNELTAYSMTDKQKILVVVAAIAAFLYNGAANRRAEEEAYNRFMRDCMQGGFLLTRSGCAVKWAEGGNR